MVIAFNHGYALVFCIVLKLLFRHFGKILDIFLAYRLERPVAPVFIGRACAGDRICLVVAFGMNVGAKCVIVYFVAVFAFLLPCQPLYKLHLCHAVLLDFFMRNLEGFGEVQLRKLHPFRLPPS